MKLTNWKLYEPYRNVVMSDEPQFIIFLPEVVHQQRKPDNQGRRTNNDSQGNQGQIFFTGKRKHQQRFYNDLLQRLELLKVEKCFKVWMNQNLLCVLDPGRGK